MELTKLATGLHTVFMDNNFIWPGYGMPTVEDLEDALHRLSKVAASKQPGTVVEAANLLVAVTDDDTLDVYVKMGSIAAPED